MDYRLILCIFVVIFTLTALPFLLIYPTSGTVIVSLGNGFFSLPRQGWHMMAVLMAGLYAPCVRGNGLLVLPVALLLLYMAGAAVEISPERYPLVRLFIPGAILSFGLLMALTTTRQEVMAALLAGSLGYHIGSHYLATQAIRYDAPLFYFTGQQLFLMLLLVFSVSIGMIIPWHRVSLRK